MRSTTTLAVVALVSTIIAYAEPTSAQPVINDRDTRQMSPTDRHSGGIKESGVFSLYDERYCSTSAASSTAKTLTAKPNLGLAGRPADGSPHSLALTYWIKTLESSLRPFDGDPILSQHRICMGLVNFGQNIITTRSGYILFDPSFFEVMNLNSGKNLDPLPVSAVILHEFGHLLQHWSSQPWPIDGSIKLWELGADCISGAILGFGVLSEIPLIARELSIHELTRLGDLLGDDGYNEPYHHGTSEERTHAYRLGISYAIAFHEAHPETRMGLKNVAKQCGYLSAGLDFFENRDHADRYLPGPFLKRTHR